MKSILLSVMCPLAAAVGEVQLATFDGAKGTTWDWKALNDPVMGGESYSKFEVNKTSKVGVWIGETKIVPSLKAPGFCNLETSAHFGVKYNDISGYTHLTMRVRSEYNYGGFKFSFAADTLNPQFRSFKADFNVTSDGKWQTVTIPFSDFSNDWSSFTGECSTTDPTGRTHVCCTEKSTEVCPTERK